MVCQPLLRSGSSHTVVPLFCSCLSVTGELVKLVSPQSFTQTLCGWGPAAWALKAHQVIPVQTQV